MSQASRLFPEISSSCMCSQEVSPLETVGSTTGETNHPLSFLSAFWEAWLICHLQTTSVTPNNCTVLLALDAFVIFAVAYVILTSGSAK